MFKGTMLETLKNAFKLPELRNRLIFTILMIVFIRFGSSGLALIPGISEEAFQAMNNFGGPTAKLVANFSRASFFAMGIMPYITASIMMNLLTIAVPRLDRMLKQDMGGREKYNQITRYLTLLLGTIQSAGLALALGIANDTTSYVVAILIMVTGTMVLMWIGEQISEQGIGNGVSLIIALNIISRIPMGVMWAIEKIQNNNLGIVAILLAVFVAIVAFVVYMHQGERRIQVQYAKRSNKISVQGGKSYIPIRVNLSGVLPVIFAASIIGVPQMLIRMLSIDASQGAWRVINQYTTMGNIETLITSTALILFFAYFSASMNFNPVQIAENLKKSGGFIPGIRPGKPTVDYIIRVKNAVILLGALFLAAVAALPTLIGMMVGTGVLGFSGTSILIAVGVSLQTLKQIEAQMLTRHYKGFLS